VINPKERKVLWSLLCPGRNCIERKREEKGGTKTGEGGGTSQNKFLPGNLKERGKELVHKSKSSLMLCTGTILQRLTSEKGLTNAK